MSVVRPGLLLTLVDPAADAVVGGADGLGDNEGVNRTLDDLATAGLACDGSYRNRRRT